MTMHQKQNKKINKTGPRGIKVINTGSAIFRFFVFFIIVLYCQRISTVEYMYFVVATACDFLVFHIVIEPFPLLLL